MTVNEAITELGKRLPLGRAEDFDNTGLLCGKPSREVSGILVSHDTLESVVDEAITSGLNLIVSFHPILFSGVKSLTGKNYVERSLLKAIENKIAIYAVHTSFDNDYFGVNYGICEALKLKNQQILLPKKNSLKRLDVYVPRDFAEKVKEALFAAGAGNIGFYDECSFAVSGNGTFRPVEGSNPFSGKLGVRENAAEEIISVIFEDFRQHSVVGNMKAAHPYEEVAYQILDLENENQYTGLGRFGNLPEEMEEEVFLRYVQKIFDLKVIRHSEFNSKKISKVGVLGGSGVGAIDAALAQNCDAYLTGDIKYHDFFKNAGKMLICDIGHYESEQFVVQQLFDILSEIFPKFAISKSVVKTNPVNYFL
ncbi:Nif3-like dinuclear metal center hexameric protein [Kaistella palustris]|uniref:Nif3-like dinuclear metal center hexameric protein n=1 Tax=Kaistella palustris TaxID=493376 RepID=UPI0003FD29DA|nr:Nif3-like dinuclear metal center hexameric protein [Kaistella palustris]